MAFNIFPTSNVPGRPLAINQTNALSAGRRDPLSDNNKENSIYSPEHVAKLPNSHIMHLENLPPGVTEMGIRNMCSNYGEVLQVIHVHPKARLVKYKSSHSVDEAIQKINADTSLGWKASHKLHGKSSSSTASDSDSSMVLPAAIDRFTTAATKATIAPKASTKSVAAVEAAAPAPKAQLNWASRKFAGPFTQPTPMTVPRGTKVTKFREPAERRHHYTDDPAVLENMRQMAAASGGQHSKLEYTFHSDNGNATTYLKPLDRQSEGPCVRCQTMSVASCEQCSDFYCSVECQRVDWPQHRTICMPMPRLVLNNGSASASTDKTVTASIARMAIEDKISTAAAATKPVTIARYPTPRTNTDVILTYAADHRRVFIRSAEPAAAEDYLRTLLAANEAALSARPLTDLPARGDVLLASYEDTFHRALVIATPADAQRIECAYLDHGNKQTLRLTELYTMPAELVGRPRHPVEVLLADVADMQTTDGESALLMDLVDAATVLRLSFDAAVHGSADDGRLRPLGVVRLTVAATNECINETLATMNRVEVVELSVAPLWLHDLRVRPVDGTDMQMLVMDNSLLKFNMLSCVRQEDLAQVVLNNQRFQEYCGRAQGPYTPRVNELCLAQCNGVWYRASCVELAGDRQPTLQLIDYGNMMHVCIDDIRKMPAEFAYALITHDYMIEGIETITADMLPVLSDFFAIGTVVRAEKVETIVADGDAVFKLHCAAVLQLLRDKGLLANHGNE